MWTATGHYISQEGSSGYVEGMIRLGDYNPGCTSSNMFVNKKHADGLEAPRNSLEISAETSRNYHTFHDNILFSHQVRQHSTKQQFHHRGGVTMKKLIDKKMSSSTARHSTPSVIARLMGMDMLPSEGSHLIHSNDPVDENLQGYLPRKSSMGGTSMHHKKYGVTSFEQTQELFAHGMKQNASGQTKSSRLTKPHHREHPQEEVLQQFKKDFEAWQATKLKEHSRATGLGENHLMGTNIQTSAIEHIGKQRNALSFSTHRHLSHRRHTEELTSPKATLGRRSQISGYEHKGYLDKEVVQTNKASINSRNEIKYNGFAWYPEVTVYENLDRSSSPTRIVVLKPINDKTDDTEESWPSPSEMLEREVSTEYFLEEVRERLRLEIEGKHGEEIRISKYSGEIPFSEKLTDPKQIAQHIAKQIRESVTRDPKATLVRSKSTRSCKGESQPNDAGSPEFLNRNTRKLLYERLRNVLQNEADFDTSTFLDRRPSITIKERASLGQLTDSKELESSSYSEDTKYISEMTTLSFRADQTKNAACVAGDPLPQSLLRSLSAPVSGTAFGKLLLEDQNVLAGVNFRRKHESREKASVNKRKARNDVLNLKGRVSHLRHNLTRRCRLFGKKMQSADESSQNGVDFTEAAASSCAVLLNLCIPLDNSTEVPPSPASVSSSNDELCKLSNPSPVSPLEMPFSEEHPSLKISSEVGTFIPVPTQPVPPAEVAASGELPNKHEAYDAAHINIKTEEETYLWSILLAAGLYDKSLDNIFTHCNELTKPVSESVFEEIEAAYPRCEVTDEMCPSQGAPCRKILFDLLNEEFVHVLSFPISSSMLRRYLLRNGVLRGRKLLDFLWRQLEVHLHPPLDESCSLRSLVAYDLGTTGWSRMLCEDIDGVGGELEFSILVALVDELVSDLC